MKINIGYIRVSTTAQLEGNGPAQQQADILAWSTMTNTPIDEWVIEDETGTIAEREKIQAVRARAERGEIGVLAVSQMSRLGRELWVSEFLCTQFKHCGVQLVSATERFDNTPMGIAMRQMAGVFAQLNKAELLQRMATCRKIAVARKGTYMGGYEPYGYRAVGKGQLDIDAPEAVLVARTFELRAQGQNYSSIARLLAQEGFRTRKGTFIAPMQVIRMLAREGVYRAEEPVNHVTLNPGVKPAQPKVIK